MVNDRKKRKSEKGKWKHPIGPRGLHKILGSVLRALKGQASSSSSQIYMLDVTDEELRRTDGIPHSPNRVRHRRTCV